MKILNLKMENTLNKLIIELQLTNANKIKCLKEIILFINDLNPRIIIDLNNIIELNNQKEYILTYIGLINYLNKNYNKELDCFFQYRKAKEFKQKNSLQSSS